MKRFIVRDELGLPMRVIRPSDPALCLRIADECLATNDMARLDNLPTEAEAAGVSYTFVGYLAKGRNGKGACIVDEKGCIIGSTLPGDSFVTLASDLATSSGSN
jgi:hypothetical protein